MTSNTVIPFRGGRSPLIRTTILGLLVICTSGALAQPSPPPCGSLNASYGPYDYRTDRDKLPIVELGHFTPPVEALIHGSSGTRFGPDLDYTLRTFPNHHRALMAVVRASEKAKSATPETLPRSVDCYFERALRFRPDDVIVRMIYAKFLVANDREIEGRHQLAVAAEMGREDGFSQYNIGLIYLVMKDYTQALVQAHKARRLGFPIDALEDQLKGAGQWKEPDDASAPPSTSESKQTPAS